MSRHRRLRQCDCLGCAGGQQGRPPSFWQRTQAWFGTAAGPLPRSRWADPIGAEDVRQQAVSGAVAHVDGGSDPAWGVAAAGTEQDHARRLRDPLGRGSAARAAEPRTVRDAVAAAHHALVRRPRAGSHYAADSAPVAHELLRQGRSESTAAKSYRLLRAILNTAVKDDRLLRENPCRMRGFDKEPTSERPTASVDQVWRLAALMPRRFRALVIFAAFTGLRWGELVALRAARC